MSKFNELLQLIHRGKNLYSNFPYEQWGGVWYDDPGAKREILTKHIDRVKPSIVVECGSFIGESSIFLAKHMKSKGMDSVIICVDTWLSGIDHRLRAPEKINMHFGRPDLFYRFIANVITNGCQDMILPLALDSLNGARLLDALNIHPQYLYIDASHEQGDAGRDYGAYWNILQSGGVMIIDDFSNHFPGVVHDWTEFAKSRSIPESKWDVSGEKIAVVKP